MRWILMLIFVILGGCAAQAQPSYDCSGRLTATERAICDSAVLSDLDVRMARQFREQRSQTAGAERNRLEYEQFKTWLPYRNACRASAECLRLRYLGRIAELQGDAAETAPASSGAQDFSITPEGIIEARTQDGSWSLYEPATGRRGKRFADGSVTWFMFITVQPGDLPVLPPSALGDWPAVISQSLDDLAGNLLTQAEVDTLKANAPPDIMDKLRFNLNAFIFVTGAGQ